VREMDWGLGKGGEVVQMVFGVSLYMRKTNTRSLLKTICSSCSICTTFFLV
jgi:hypothetical protein